MALKPAIEDIESTINSLKEIANYVFITYDEDSESKYIEYAETCISCAEELGRLIEYMKVRNYGK